MTTRRAVALAVLTLFLGAISGVPDDAHAGIYAGTKCVSDKLKTSGKHCKSLLKAWSKWDKDQDNMKRDDAIAAAVTKFTERWALYETKAADKGAECAETTLSSGDMETLIDGAVDAIVADVNGGLDLVGNDDHKKCGSAILKAAREQVPGFPQSGKQAPEDAREGSARPQSRRVADGRESEVQREVGVGDGGELPDDRDRIQRRDRGR